MLESPSCRKVSITPDKGLTTLLFFVQRTFCQTSAFLQWIMGWIFVSGRGDHVTTLLFKPWVQSLSLSEEIAGLHKALHVAWASLEMTLE